MSHIFFSQQKYFEAFNGVMGLCGSGNMENFQIGDWE